MARRRRSQAYRKLGTYKRDLIKLPAGVYATARHTANVVFGHGRQRKGRGGRKRWGIL